MRHPVLTKRPLPLLPAPLRRAVFGYRRKDVLAVLEHLKWQMDGLASSVERLYLERAELKEQLDHADAARAAALETQAADLQRAADERRATARAEAERHLAETRAQAAELLAEASEQAARLRHEAGLRVGDAASRLEDLLHVREQLLGELRGLVETYAGVIEHHESQRLPGPARDVEVLPGSDAAAWASRPRAETSGLYPTRVQLDAGPFEDFAQLSAFERALARLPKVDDVYIRGFGDERAVIELSLTEQTPLAHDLSTKLPYGLRIEQGSESGTLHIEVLERAVNE